jgi:hypothetical protein
LLRTSPRRRGPALARGTSQHGARMDARHVMFPALRSWRSRAV